MLEDLMVGSIVRYKDEKRIKPHLRGKLHVIIPDDILALEEGNDLIVPADLTAGIMHSMDFKPFGKDWVKHGVIIHTRKRGFVFRKSVPDLIHIHQLQRLVKSLTGKRIMSIENLKKLVDRINSGL
jgi:hypothetical protein